MRRTPVNDYLEEISTELSEEVYGCLSDAIYETTCDFDEEIGLLKAENAKLIDVLHEVEQEAIHAYHCLQQDCVTIANSSEHYFKKWWHAECELERARAGNTKLRELMLEIWRSCPVSEDDCAKCPHRVEESDEVWCDIPFLMESLGVEVPE